MSKKYRGVKGDSLERMVKEKGAQYYLCCYGFYTWYSEMSQDFRIDKNDLDIILFDRSHATQTRNQIAARIEHYYLK